MTFPEALAKEKRWQNRALIINLFHQKMCLAKNHWSLRLTARSLKISLGAASEAMKLAKAIIDEPLYDNLTREQVLRIIRKS